MLKAGLYGTEEIDEAGTILEFVFQALSSINEETEISLEFFRINDEIVQRATSVVSIHSTHVPADFTLNQNYPNPFNPATVIPYHLPNSGNVQLKIYNLLGQEIITLLDGFQSEGFHEYRWDGKDKSGISVTGGVYICEMLFNNMRQTIKLIKLN